MPLPLRFSIFCQTRARRRPPLPPQSVALTNGAERWNGGRGRQRVEGTPSVRTGSLWWVIHPQITQWKSHGTS
jgi:hypothetical protein